jgi:hypothetical protein
MFDTYHSTWSIVHHRFPARAVRQVLLDFQHLFPTVIRLLLLVYDTLRPSSQLVTSAPCPAGTRAERHLSKNSLACAHCRRAGQEPSAVRRQEAACRGSRAVCAPPSHLPAAPGGSHAPAPQVVQVRRAGRLLLQQRLHLWRRVEAQLVRALPPAPTALTLSRLSQGGSPHCLGRCADARQG